MNAARARPPTFFFLSSLVFLGTAIYHVVRYATDQPMPRHLLFVGSSLLFSALIFFRPRSLAPLVTVLTLQQIYSHGGDAWRAWTRRGELDLMSLAICAYLPVLVFAAWKDYRRRRV